MVGRNLAKKQTPRAFEVLLWALLSSLAFSCASEHLSPWIYRGRLKAPVLLRLRFGRAITEDGTLRLGWDRDNSDHQQRRRRVGEGRGRSGPRLGVGRVSSLSPCDLTFSTGRYCLFPFSTPLHTPRQHHELARVRSFTIVLVSNSEFHLRFKKSMNRAGTTVRMEPLVFPSADNLP